MDISGDQFDVIVIGAGVMGSCAAYQIAKRGRKTLLLEQFDLLHYRGSSHGQSRTIRSTYPEEYYSAMVMESSKLWEDAESEVGYKVLFRTTQLDMGLEDDKSLQSAIANCWKNSIPHRILDPGQVSDEFSGKIKVPEKWVGLKSDHGGVINPTKAVSMFQTLAVKNGAILKDNMKVEDIAVMRDKERGGIEVLTANGEKFWGQKCVVTAGAWMAKLIKRTRGLTLPIHPLETSVQYWRIQEGHEADFTIGGGFPTFASYGDPYIYGTPSLEFPGLIKIAVHGGRPCDPDRRKWATESIALDSLKQWIKGRFGDLVDSTAPVMTQSCMYSMTPDEDFVIDFLDIDGEFGKDVVIAGGFSGHGFKMAPVVGQVLADLVINGETKEGVDIKQFRLERFEGNPKGNVKEFNDQVNLFFNGDC